MKSNAVHSSLPAQNLVTQVLDLACAPTAERPGRWAALLAQSLDAARVEPDLGGAHGAGLAVQITPAGQGLWLPALADLPAMVVHRSQHRRAFDLRDQQWATQLHALACRVLAGDGAHQQGAYQQGAAGERARIACDLHDDLGAKLLSLAHASAADAAVAALAREALQEMRLIVHHLAAQPLPLGEVLADWRAECITRLHAAEVSVDWQADVNAADQAALVSPRAAMHLTRVLRESVTNLINHSGAAQCRVRLALDSEKFSLSIEDNGCGLRADQTAGQRAGQAGMGLTHIERRVQGLQGQFQWLASTLGGVLLQVQVPRKTMF
ncbi:sensor histidine kinase [Ottowia sp.]|uniref:sensor histidine kinase n=1 Tax=Ottowia sp. TaxID=1898956 RepID=UPI003A8615B4